MPAIMLVKFEHLMLSASATFHSHAEHAEVRHAFWHFSPVGAARYPGARPNTAPQLFAHTVLIIEQNTCLFPYEPARVLPSQVRFLARPL